MLETNDGIVKYNNDQDFNISYAIYKRTSINGVLYGKSYLLPCVDCRYSRGGWMVQWIFTEDGKNISLGLVT